MQKLKELVSGLKLLYIEDDELIRNEFVRTLKRLFNNIEVEIDGKKGLEKVIKDNKIDLIITDINMPNMSGLEMIKSIRNLENHKKEIPIIIFSAYNNSDYLLKAIEYGVDGFIEKPLSNLDSLKKTIEKVVKNILLKKENFEYKNNLENKIKEQMEEIKEKTLIAQKQTKFAEMGEMIDMIAHQWKQPLNVIAMYISILEFNFDDIKEDLNQEFNKEIKDGIKVIREQIQHLVETLDEFRDFFRPDENQKVERIKLKDILKSVKVLLKDLLIKYKIDLQEEFNEEIELIVNPNEFKHIFINLISNAKDAFESRNINNRVINITAEIKENQIIIKIKDNAGGIHKDFLDKIFDANFTTKELENGTGMGLYMSKLIAKKHGGDLNAKNCENGVEFALTTDFV